MWKGFFLTGAKDWREKCVQYEALATDDEFKRIQCAKISIWSAEQRSLCPGLSSIFDFTKISGPIALFCDSSDRLADLKDVYWLQEQLSDSFVYKEKLYFGRASFLCCRNMTYLNTVISLVNKYN